MKKIEKTVGRDLALLDILVWHHGYTIGMKEWLGWSYSDAVFHVHDGYTEIMRPIPEHWEDFYREVSSRIDADQNWFEAEYNKFMKYHSEVQAFYDRELKNVTNQSATELWKTYVEYKEKINKALGLFISLFWFPIFCEKDEDRLKKYEKEIALCVKARKASELMFPTGAELISAILDNVAKKTGLARSDLKYMSDHELETYAKDGSLPDVVVLKKRRDGFLFSKKGLIFTTNEPREVKKLIAEIGYDFVLEEVGDVKEIKGNVAYKGVTKGVCRVILSKESIQSMRDGEVLIASMTTPEYLPAMKKAAAFITDEGGITCHAAIVARELKKPCIIGTKIATKALKTGDEVVVDADKGTITIIKRG